MTMESPTWPLQGLNPLTAAMADVDWSATEDVALVEVKVGSLPRLLQWPRMPWL